MPEQISIGRGTMINAPMKTSQRAEYYFNSMKKAWKSSEYLNCEGCSDESTQNGLIFGNSMGRNGTWMKRSVT